MSVLHRALIGVYTQVDSHLVAHKRVAKALYRMSDVHGVSPVFHVSEEEKEGLVVAYSLRTQLTPDELAEKIEMLDAVTKINKAEIYILVFDDYIIRKPSCVVPWVELHSSKKWSIPSAYIWPDYIHPIEAKDLKTLSESLQTNETIEFYSQSKSVLDFLNLET